MEQEGRMTEEQREERLHHHLYDTNEGIEQQSNRIVDLEELVLDLWPRASFTMRPADRAAWVGRMRGLGIEVGEES